MSLLLIRLVYLIRLQPRCGDLSECAQVAVYQGIRMGRPLQVISSADALCQSSWLCLLQVSFERKR